MTELQGIIKKLREGNVKRIFIQFAEGLKLRIQEIVKKIEDAYFSEKKRKEFSIKGLKFAKQFDWDKIFQEKWLPLLETLDSLPLNKISSS